MNRESPCSQQSSWRHHEVKSGLHPLTLLTATDVDHLPFVLALKYQSSNIHLYLTSEEPVFCADTDSRFHTKYVKSTILESQLLSQLWILLLPTDVSAASSAMTLYTTTFLRTNVPCHFTMSALKDRVPLRWGSFKFIVSRNRHTKFSEKGLYSYSVLSLRETFAMQ